MNLSNFIYLTEPSFFCDIHWIGGGGGGGGGVGWGGGGGGAMKA